jgi:hypothetical protein
MILLSTCRDLESGTIDEVVKTVIFAIENDFVNVEVINVNGGLTI